MGECAQNMGQVGTVQKMETSDFVRYGLAKYFAQYIFY